MDIIWNNIPLCLKAKIFNQCIIPAMTYGCETWTLTNIMINRLRVTINNMERNMMNIRLRDKIRVKDTRSKTKIRDIIEVIKKSKWRWAGHLARFKDYR